MDLVTASPLLSSCKNQLICFLGNTGKILVGRGMKKWLLGPVDFVWWCDHGVTISRAAHAAKQCNLYSNFPAKLLTNVSRWWNNEQGALWFKGQCLHTAAVPQIIANTCRIKVNHMQDKCSCNKKEEEHIGTGQKIRIELVKFWSHISFELPFRGYEKSNF